MCILINLIISVGLINLAYKFFIFSFKCCQLQSSEATPSLSPRPMRNYSRNWGLVHIWCPLWSSINNNSVAMSLSLRKSTRMLMSTISDRSSKNLITTLRWSRIFWKKSIKGKSRIQWNSNVVKASQFCMTQESRR